MLFFIVYLRGLGPNFLGARAFYGNVQKKELPVQGANMKMFGWVTKDVMQE